MPQALLLILVLSLSAFAQTGKVVGVTDGDTITVLSNRKQIKVRLAGIDAPEKGQPFSQIAKKELSTLVFNRQVRIEARKTDRYGRTVADVSVHAPSQPLGWVSVGLWMIRSGYAWHYKEYEKEQPSYERKAFAQAEKYARSEKIGIWSDPSPVAPWDFRKGESTAQKATTTVRPLGSRPIYQSTGGQIIGNKNSMIYHFPSCPSYDKVAEKNRVYF